jgi:hypothetical protein
MQLTAYHYMSPEEGNDFISLISARILLPVSTAFINGFDATSEESKPATVVPAETLQAALPLGMSATTGTQFGSSTENEHGLNGWQAYERHGLMTCE